MSCTFLRGRLTRLLFLLLRHWAIVVLMRLSVLNEMQTLLTRIVPSPDCPPVNYRASPDVSSADGVLFRSLLDIFFLALF